MKVINLETKKSVSVLSQEETMIVNAGRMPKDAAQYSSWAMIGNSLIKKI